MNQKLVAVTLITAVLVPLAALAQEAADVKMFEAPLPPALTAPTTPETPLPGPKVVTADTCQHAPEVCKARREELRRKRQACADNPQDCRDPALSGSAKRD